MPQWSATAWVAASRAAVWGRDDVQIVRKAIKVSPACKLFPSPPPLARAPFSRGGSQGPKLFEELLFLVNFFCFCAFAETGGSGFFQRETLIPSHF